VLPVKGGFNFLVWENLNGAGVQSGPSHFLTFYFLYLSNYIIFRFHFFARHSKITNRMGENSFDFFANLNLKLFKNSKYFFINIYT
jgi:hypothetical protein